MFNQYTHLKNVSVLDPRRAKKPLTEEQNELLIEVFPKMYKKVYVSQKDVEELLKWMSYNDDSTLNWTLLSCFGIKPRENCEIKLA